MKLKLTPVLFLSMTLFFASCLEEVGPPKLDDQFYTIEENTPNGSVVAQIEVINPNSNSGITFTLISGNTDDAFAFNEETGEITVANQDALDFEVNPTFNIVVEVANKSKSTEVLITINLIDICEIPTDGLVAYYPFNGNANDESSNSNDGTLYGATLVSDRHDSPNSAYSFDGIDDYVVVNDHESLNPSEMTISVWYKPVSFDGGSWPVLTKGYTSHVAPYYQYHIGITGDGHASPGKLGGNFGINNEYIGLATNTNFYQVGNWYHIVISFDGEYFKLYINGDLNTESYSPGVLASYGQDLYISRLFNNGKYLPGTIDDIRIYNRALLDCEIELLSAE